MFHLYDSGQHCGGRQTLIPLHLITPAMAALPLKHNRSDVGGFTDITLDESEGCDSFIYLIGILCCTLEHLTHTIGGWEETGQCQKETHYHLQAAERPSHVWLDRKSAWDGLYPLRALWAYIYVLHLVPFEGHRWQTFL